MVWPWFPLTMILPADFVPLSQCTINCISHMTHTSVHIHSHLIELKSDAVCKCAYLCVDFQWLVGWIVNFPRCCQVLARRAHIVSSMQLGTSHSYPLWALLAKGAWTPQIATCDYIKIICINVQYTFVICERLASYLGYFPAMCAMLSF